MLSERESKKDHVLRSPLLGDVSDEWRAFSSREKWGEGRRCRLYGEA